MTGIYTQNKKGFLLEAWSAFLLVIMVSNKEKFSVEFLMKNGCFSHDYGYFKQSLIINWLVSLGKILKKTLFITCMFLGK